MQYLRFGTTTYKPIGPLVDAVTGTSMTTNATAAGADSALILKHNTTVGTTMQELTAWSSISPGYMLYPFTTAETDTVGPLTVVLTDEDLFLAHRQEFTVMNGPAYDGLFGTSASTVFLPVNTAQINKAWTTGAGKSTDLWRG